MKRLGALLLVGALAQGCASLRGDRAPEAPRGAASLPAPAAAIERLVLVTVHGLAPGHYLADDPAMPALASLARAGVAAEAMTPIFPGAVYPAHATLATGVEPARHGVGGDRRIGERGVGPGLVDRAEDLQAPTLFESLAQVGRPVAALDWPSSGGAPIADLAPDLELPAGASWAEALASRGAGRAAELAERARGGDPAAAQPGAARDAALVTMACALLVGENAPRLVALRLSQTAQALAGAPPGADVARAAFARADADLARLVRCLGDAGLLEGTGIAVAGDVALVAAHTELRPNVALAEAGLLVPADGGVLRWDAIARSGGGSAFVYAADDDAALLARRALEAFANESGASRVMSAQEMVARGADPEAWFGLEAEPGFTFGDAATGAPWAPSRAASASTSREGAAVGFVAWGPGLRAGLRVPLMRQTDVAPTLARWLGVRMGDVDGRALVGLFTTGGA